MSLRIFIKSTSLGKALWPFLSEEKLKYYHRMTQRACRKACNKLKKLEKKRPHIFYCGVCETSNMGDMAQTYCIYEWLKANYPEYQIVECKTTYLVDDKKKHMLHIIKEKMNKDDIIVFQSGYNTHDLGGREDIMHQLMMKNFPNTEMIMFPQTVFFKSEQRRKQASETYNQHKHLLFFARDPVSENIAREMFPNIPVMLYPDIVTSLIGRFPVPKHERKGIWLCKRNDVEQYYEKKDYINFASIMSKYDEVAVGDTIIKASEKIIRTELYKAVYDMVDIFAHYRLTVTDKYHGMIFSLVSNTPVIVMRTKDHKVTSGYEWFSKVYPDKVFFAENPHELNDLAYKILSNAAYDVLDDFFAREYYDKLNEVIGAWVNDNRNLYP